jgi:hypothetical protein
MQQWKPVNANIYFDDVVNSNSIVYQKMSNTLQEPQVSYEGEQRYEGFASAISNQVVNG